MVGGSMKYTECSEMLKATILIAAMQFVFIPLSQASGGSIYRNSIGFAVVGIDDSTWTDIKICDSEDSAYEGSRSHCLILKKGAKGEHGWTTYSDTKSGCRLMGRYVEENFATGDTDDDYMLKQFFVIIKVPKGMRGCTLLFNSTGTPSRRSVTGLYRTAS